MSAIERFANELTEVVFSGQSKNLVLVEVAKRMRCVLDSHQHDHSEESLELKDAGWNEAELPDCSGETKGLRTGRCPRTGHSCIGALISNPGHFTAGHLVGEAIQASLEGRLEKKGFRNRLIEIFQSPPQDNLVQN